jgi:hypothetical protein
MKLRALLRLALHCFALNVVAPMRLTHALATLLARSASLWTKPGCAARLLVMLLLTLPAMGQAQFTYTIKNGAITITGYDRSGGAVTIPGTINGLPVTSIGSQAFYIDTSLTSVTIPSSVTSFGRSAFAGCTNLTDLTIPDGVTSIGDYAFIQCASLMSVSIPNSVTSIGDGVFYSCTSLTNVMIPNSVISFGRTAFAYCSSLTDLNIPNSVTSIGDYAFTDCSSLRSLTIPNSVTRIGDAAFAHCARLSAIMVEAVNSAYSSVDGVLFDLTQSALLQCPGAKTGDYTIPSSVTNIAHSAFAGCAGLTGVTIPNSVTDVGGYAFYDCQRLSSLTFPESVTFIGAGACYGCTNLTGVYFKGNAPSIGGWDEFSGEGQFEDTIVYYLPGSAGWSSTFAGRPTMVWNPEVITIGSRVRIRENQFGFTITWASGPVVVVEVSADLGNPVWTPVSTNTLTGGSTYFSDPQWKNYPRRFYRAISPVP